MEKKFKYNFAVTANIINCIKLFDLEEFKKSISVYMSRINKPYTILILRNICNQMQYAVNDEIKLLNEMRKIIFENCVEHYNEKCSCGKLLFAHFSKSVEKKHKGF